MRWFRDRHRQTWETVAVVSLIFLLNAMICGPLFRIHWADHMFSIEGAYIALTRYVVENFPDVGWFPLWNAGEPFQATYQPGLPLISALITAVLRMDAARGYHVTIALFYCLGPVGMFFLVKQLSGRLRPAVFAAVLLSIFSPSAVIPFIRHDLGSALFAERFKVLAVFGEGPNVAGLSLVPFALWGVDSVFRKLSALRFTLAASALAATILVSWPAGVVMACGVLALLLCRDWPEVKSRLPRLACLAVVSYLLVAPLVLPSTIRNNQRNSQQIDGRYPYTSRHLMYFGILAVALVLSRSVLRRIRAALPFQFGWYWCLIPSSIAIAAFASNLAVLPQPKRFHVAMEFGMTICMASVLGAAVDRLPRFRTALVAGLALVALLQARNYARYARRVETPINIAGTLEYQVAQWLNRNLPNQRVYLGGSTRLWVNAWTDQPQVHGCCLPGMPNPMTWLVYYQVPSGDGAGARDEEISELWLRTWGAQALLESGPRTRDAYVDWLHPHKFDTAFQVVWQQGDDRIYRVPNASASLAHVIRAEEVIRRSPENGVDVEPLRPYVRALEDGSRAQASFEWLSRHEARIRADLQTADLVSVQETWDPGWRASADGRAVPISRDGMGFLLLRPNRAGPTTIDLRFGPSLEAAVFRVLCFLSWAALGCWVAVGTARKRRYSG